MKYFPSMRRKSQSPFAQLRQVQYSMRQSRAFALVQDRIRGTGASVFEEKLFQSSTRRPLRTTRPQTFNVSGVSESHVMPSVSSTCTQEAADPARIGGYRQLLRNGTPAVFRAICILGGPPSRGPAFRSGTMRESTLWSEYSSRPRRPSAGSGPTVPPANPHANPRPSRLTPRVAGSRHLRLDRPSG